MGERRKTARILTRIPLRVRGADYLGVPFVEEASTVEINRDGARIPLKNMPRFGSELEITNLSNDLIARFVITQQCPQSYGDRPEWGVEFSGPVEDYWSISFEERKEEEEVIVSALLSCSACARQEVVNLSWGEYEVLRTNLFLPRPCPPCGMVTNWQVGAAGEEDCGTPPGAPAAAAEATPAAAEDGKEQRRARRLTLKVPLLVGSENGAQEKTVTEDLSKAGLSFAASLEFAEGEQIHVIVGYGVAKNPSVRASRATWRKPRQKSLRYLYGARFVEAG